MPLFDGKWKIKRRGTRATPVPQSQGGWTVLWETRHDMGVIGWNMTRAEAIVLATKIELGEFDV